MKKERRYIGLRQHLRAHWPPYFLTYGAIMVTLLPLPNESVQTVILSQTAVELHQRDKQVVLFKGIRRVLAETDESTV